jgi:uncharacterized protein
MRLENTFDVAAPHDVAWRLLSDVPQVLPCMPGAELVEVVSDDSWKARLHVKLGPIALQFLADVKREAMDEGAGRVVLLAKAREARGRGSADARIESLVSDADGEGTRVDLVTELELRGAVAQYGRGVVADVAARLTREFADCLARTLADRETGEARDPGAQAQPDGRRDQKPINALRLIVAALLRPLTSRLGGLTSRRHD